MANYDLTWMNSSTNLLEVVQDVNTASGNLYGTLILLAVWIGAYLVFKKEDGLQDFIVSSFIASVVAVMLVLIGLLTWQFTIMPIFATFISFLIYNTQ